MSDAPTSRPVHVRTIRVEIAQAGPHELEVTATLVDERPADNPKWFGSDPPPVIHDMRLGLRVRHPDLVVTEVRSEMASHPYTICPEALPPLQQLVGLSIAHGFTREVNERFGRQRGCAHFTALIHAVAPAVRHGYNVRRVGSSGTTSRGQGQHHPRPADEDHVDPDERPDHPDRGSGQLPSDVDAEQQCDDPAQEQPAPVRQVHHDGGDNAEEAPIMKNLAMSSVRTGAPAAGLVTSRKPATTEGTPLTTCSRIPLHFDWWKAHTASIAPVNSKSQPKRSTDAIVATTETATENVSTRIRTMPSPSSHPHFSASGPVLPLRLGWPSIVSRREVSRRLPRESGPVWDRATGRTLGFGRHRVNVRAVDIVFIS